MYVFFIFIDVLSQFTECQIVEQHLFNASAICSKHRLIYPSGLEIAHVLASSKLINPLYLNVVIMIQGDCIGVVKAGVWFSLSSGWLSCQSVCPNVEQ